MLYKFIIVLVIGVLGVAAIFYDATDIPVVPKTQTEPQQTTNAQDNDAKLPPITFQGFYGDDFALADFKDKIILVNFWASWCAPCVTELPELFRIAASNDIIFIAVDMDKKKEKAEALLEKLKKKHPDMVIPNNTHFAWDPRWEIARDIFKTTKLPETYLIGTDMQIKEKIVGDDIEKLETVLEQLMSQ